MKYCSPNGGQTFSLWCEE